MRLKTAACFYERIIMRIKTAAEVLQKLAEGLVDSHSRQYVYIYIYEGLRPLAPASFLWLLLAGLLACLLVLARLARLTYWKAWG